MGLFSPILSILLTSLTFVFFNYFFAIPLAINHHLMEHEREKKVPSYPYISIMIPAYNEEGYVGRCIESVLEADYPARKMQIIVIDDGSTDGTLSEAKEYEKSSKDDQEYDVQVLSKENGGKHSALNYGSIYAKGKYIFTIDADSIITRRSLKLMIRRFEDSDDVGAVASNVKIINRDNFLTWCQSLEYLMSINIFRSALDAFGTVSVVPGCLGAFKKKFLEDGGFYDPNTLTEDFDTTVKMRKLGKTVQASSGAVVFTEGPDTWKDLYKQRLRWNIGTIQTILKHKNVFLNSRYGLLRSFVFPLLLVSMFFLPIANVVVLISIIHGILTGLIVEVTIIFFFFNLLMILTSSIAIQVGDEDPKHLLFVPFLVVGYIQLLDMIKLKSLLDMIRGKAVWTSPTRIRKREERKKE
ncbi:MAG: glycosyltransferase [Candidatus Natronoplasma sp.]